MMKYETPAVRDVGSVVNATFGAVGSVCDTITSLIP